MRRIVLWGMSTLTVLVLLFGYHTSTSSQAAAGGQSSAVAPVQSGSAATSGPASAGTSTASRTVSGDEASSRWGRVQGELTVAYGSISDVSVVQYPSGNGRDQQINARALPVLI